MSSIAGKWWDSLHSAHPTIARVLHINPEAPAKSEPPDVGAGAIQERNRLAVTVAVE